MKNGIKLYPSVVMLFLGFLLLQSCASKRPQKAFSALKSPKAPDYTDLQNWAAHPDKRDPADSIPAKSGLTNTQAESQVDVFFIHPTTYTYKRGNNQWNGDLSNAALNRKTDGGSILYQASLFNGVGRVFAPRYRQAHYFSYFAKDTASARQAFELAYTDVQSAFEFYLKNWNQNRPIIIAAHSQGTQHATRLLKAFFDGTPLGNRLVVAYIPGLPVLRNTFKNIPLCSAPEQTGCFCSWRTFKKGYEPNHRFPLGEQIAVVNPLSWSVDNAIVTPDKHKGAVLFGFKKTAPQLLDAQVHKGILWVSKPKFKGSFLYRSNNFHAGDLNLFYMNIREDVERRVGLFWKR